MEELLKNTYDEGFKKGFKEGTKSGQRVDFKIELVRLLQATKGVGDKTITKVMQTLKEME